MGITLAIFNLPGTVARDLFIMWMMGITVKCIDCLSILLEIPLWTKLDQDLCVFSTIVGGTNSFKNTLYEYENGYHT